MLHGVLILLYAIVVISVLIEGKCDISREYVLNCCDISREYVLNCSNISLNKFPRERYGNNITAFDFSHNEITFLGNKSFKYYFRSLPEIVLLNDNRINCIESNAFFNLSKLRLLDLSKNNISFLHPDTFKYTIVLQNLSLSFNNIATMFPIYSGSLKQLDISFCSVMKIPDNTFKNATSVTSLDISNNLLESISFLVLKPLQNLTVLRLFGNPWLCFCELKEVVDWLFENNLNISILCKTSSNMLFIMDENTDCEDYTTTETVISTILSTEESETTVLEYEDVEIMFIPEDNDTLSEAIVESKNGDYISVYFIYPWSFIISSVGIAFACLSLRKFREPFDEYWWEEPSNYINQ